MNWLASVLRQINKCERPEAHRNLMMIRVIDLSEICDRFVPQAPEPSVACDLEFRVWWIWRSRELVVGVAGDGVCTLSLVDGEHRSRVEGPNFEQIKTSVRSFFEGWEPRT